MKFHSVVRYGFLLLASLILAACGGGGASTNPNQGGDLTVFPSEGTFYAGIVARLTISGGRLPYSLTSSEPAVLDVPVQLNGHTLEVVPNNPGTIDAGLPPDSVPIRTVTIFVRDSIGLRASAEIHVAHNFLTGYTVLFQPTNCTAQACAGGTTLIQFGTETNGVRYGLRPFRAEMVRGGCLLEDPLGSNTLNTSVTTASDHEGKVIVAIRCPGGIPSGVGVIRLVDIGTGASTDFAFTISDESPSSNLEAIPDSFTFTGADSSQCGTGTADFFVFGGEPPFTAVSTSPNVVVTPSSDAQPGKFTITAGNPSTCVEAQVIVIDNRGGHVTVDVTTEAGTGAPPPPPLSVTPSTITLACGASGSVIFTGGSGSVSAATTDSNLSTSISGNTITVTRAGAPPPLSANVNSTVTLTDGTSTTRLTVINPGTCS